MKNVILILGILTTVMVFGVVAGVSTNASPPALDMNLDDEQCRDCHGDNLKNEHHSSSFWSKGECFECHEEVDEKYEIEMNKTCGLNGDCHFRIDSELPTELVTEHHDFTVIFDNDDWDCLICHEKGVPRPLDK